MIAIFSCLPCHDWYFQKKSDSYSGHHEHQDGMKKVSYSRKMSSAGVDEKDWIEKASSSRKLNSTSIELLDKEG